jgi:Tetratricopeptide repeat
MELAANKYDQAIGVCTRGLQRRPGAVSRAWLLRIKAQSLIAQGRLAEARQVLQEANAAAEQIPSKQSRDAIMAAIKKVTATRN